MAIEELARMLMQQDEKESERERTTSMSAREAPSEQEKRQRLSREARMQHILAVSQALFSTNAYDEIAIEDFAAAAGMSKGLLYHYFASKRELYLATLRNVLAQMLQFTDLHPDLHAGLAETLSLFEQYPAWQRWCCVRESARIPRWMRSSPIIASSS